MTTVTRVLIVDPSHPDADVIADAAKVLAAGRLVAFPTETVYGLGANALDPMAVERIFAAKQRPYTDPLIVHLASAAQLPQVAVEIPPVAGTLAARFWPGPLTLVLRCGRSVAANVSAGRDTVAVRVPSHPVAHALLTACGLPIAAPSANLFSRPSPTTAQHVLEDLNGRVDVILDGGPTTIGLESTVIDLTQMPPVLLRPGGASITALREVLPDLRVPDAPVIAAEGEATASPGTLLRHYSPRAPLFLLRGDTAGAARLAEDVVTHLHRFGLHTGLLIPDDEFAAYRELHAELIALGPAHDMTVIGRYLFARLRELDSLGVDLILARDVASEEEGGLEPAIRDRLFRAAEGRMLDAGDPDALDRLVSIITAARD